LICTVSKKKNIYIYKKKSPTVLPLLHPSNGTFISSYFITSTQMILCPCHLHASTNISFTNQLLMQLITEHCIFCASQPATHHLQRTCSSYIWNYLALYCNVHIFCIFLTFYTSYCHSA